MEFSMFSNLFPIFRACFNRSMVLVDLAKKYVCNAFPYLGKDEARQQSKFNIRFLLNFSINKLIYE